jgi:hypothetical protein
MSKIIYCLPRIISILIVLFFGIFILEGFGPGFNSQDLLSHLILALVVLAITIVSWKWPKVGGWLFVFLGILFSWFFHPLWLNGFIIGGVTLLSGVLFLIAKKRF